MLNLVKKDFKANRNLLITMLIGSLIMAVMVLSVAQKVYASQCAEFLVLQIFVIFGFERIRNKESLISSLPLKRSTAVFGRYLFSAAVMVLGIIFFAIIIYPLDMVSAKLAVEYPKILTAGNLFLSALFISCLSGIWLLV